MRSLIVVGSGIAGLFTALSAHRRGVRDVLIVTKGALEESTTRYAQGGIAAAVGDGDSWNFTRPIRSAPEPSCAIRRRCACSSGTPPNEWPISCGWVSASTWRTGASCMRGKGPTVSLACSMSAAMRPASTSSWPGPSSSRARHRGARPHIRLGVDRRSRPVPRCPVAGGRCDRGRGGGVGRGGAGQLYSCTTNPSISTGDGVALGLRAGAAVADLEFFQFHPTAFAGSGARRFLISEAVRGHGAVLRNHLGEAFMARYDERRELAPRDIVARSIVREMERYSLPSVWLDATQFPRGEFAHRFPTIHAHCVGQGCDPEREPIPVSPAAHYMMGGVWTDTCGRDIGPGPVRLRRNRRHRRPRRQPPGQQFSARRRRLRSSRRPGPHQTLGSQSWASGRS